jgi:multidrug transporter EmrE-like cation transporter
MDVIFELITSTVFAAAGQVSWRMGMRNIGPLEVYDIGSFFKVFTNWQVDLGLILYALSTLFWLSALSKKDLSYSYPFIAGTYIMVLLLSYFVLGENFNITRAVGAGVVLAGLFIIIKGG